MGYLFLVLATLSGAVKGFCGKKVSGYVKKLPDAMLANLIRMTICIAIGCAMVIIPEGIDGFDVGAKGIFISALSGVSSAAFVVIWLFCVQRGAYMLVDVFLTVGLLVPISLCAIFFGESIEWNHYVGFAVLIVAVYIMCSYNNSVKAKMGIKTFLLLILCGVAQGVSSFSQKYFVRYTGGGGIAAFNFYTYIFAAVALGVCYLIFSTKARASGDASDFRFKPIWYFIVIMAVMLFLNSYLMTLSAVRLDAVLIYPLSTGLALVISTAMSRIFFGERLNIKCFVGIALAFCAMIFINVL